MTEVLLGAVGLLLGVAWIISVVDILRRHLGTGPTAAWLCLVLLLPFAGSLLYWMLRKPTPEEVQRQADAQAELRRAPPPPYSGGPR